MRRLDRLPDLRTVHLWEQAVRITGRGLASAALYLLTLLSPTIALTLIVLWATGLI